MQPNDKKVSLTERETDRQRSPLAGEIQSKNKKQKQKLVRLSNSTTTQLKVYSRFIELLAPGAAEVQTNHAA